MHHPAYRTKAKQTVIYHPNYASEANIKNQEHSKQELGLEPNKHLFLSFGKIRHQAEEDFIVDAFVKQALPNTALWICSALPLPSWKQQPLARWKGEARRRSLKKKQVLFLDRKIPSEEIPTLFSAADAIVLPRLNTLNSGVLFLAFTYGKVVIGPACGNMNEFLSKHNNPLFQPRNLQSLQHAFQQSIQADSRVGQLNKQFAEEFCNPSLIAKQHQLFYASLL
jgi:glycosyltransferase involved in cell wall biosynthesis